MEKGRLVHSEERGTWMGIIIPYICHSNNQLIYTAVVVSPGETVICFAFFFFFFQVELLLILLLRNF